MRLIDLDLTFDQINDASAYTYSDHNAFWMNGIPAVMVFENFSFQAEGVCGVTDRNFRYHNTADTLAYINQETGFSIFRASLAALAQIAGPFEIDLDQSTPTSGFAPAER